MIDTVSYPGAWVDALARGCLEGRVHTSPSDDAPLVVAKVGGGDGCAPAGLFGPDHGSANT